MPSKPEVVEETRSRDCRVDPMGMSRLDEAPRASLNGGHHHRAGLGLAPLGRGDGN